MLLLYCDSNIYNNSHSWLYSLLKHCHRVLNILCAGCIIYEAIFYRSLFTSDAFTNYSNAWIKDKTLSFRLLVWHQIPFIRALQRLQNPPDELNHCLCLFTWYVTYKCTKYKTFKDKCFTQKKKKSLPNQSKCYGFKLRCNCKVGKITSWLTLWCTQSSVRSGTNGRSVDRVDTWVS